MAAAGSKKLQGAHKLICNVLEEPHNDLKLFIRSRLQKIIEVCIIEKNI